MPGAGTLFAPPLVKGPESGGTAGRGNPRGHRTLRAARAPAAFRGGRSWRPGRRGHGWVALRACRRLCRRYMRFFTCLSIALKAQRRTCCRRQGRRLGRLWSCGAKGSVGFDFKPSCFVPPCAVCMCGAIKFQISVLVLGRWSSLWSSFCPCRHHRHRRRHRGRRRSSSSSSSLSSRSWAWAWSSSSSSSSSFLVIIVVVVSGHRRYCSCSYCHSQFSSSAGRHSLRCCSRACPEHSTRPWLLGATLPCWPGLG